MDAQQRVLVLDAPELGGAQLLQFAGLFGHAHQVQGAVEFLGEQGGAQIVIAAVNGEDQQPARMRPHRLEVLEIGDVPAHLAAEMQVPEAVEVGQGELQEDLAARPPAAPRAEVRAQGRQVAEHGPALRAGEQVDDQHDGPGQQQAERRRQHPQRPQQQPGPERPVQTGVAPMRHLRWRRFGGFFVGHGRRVSACPRIPYASA